MTSAPTVPTSALQPTGPTSVAPPVDMAGPLDNARVMNVAVKGSVRMAELSVLLPAIYQNVVGWGDGRKVTLSSEGYDYLNRSMGVRFYQPEWTHDQTGELVRNPIHRKDYLLLTLVGIWWNDMGQMQVYRETVELDYALIYNDARINSRSAEIAKDDAGRIIRDPQTFAPYVTCNEADELKALRTLSQLRTFGFRTIHTVAKTRILKVATAIKTLPLGQGGNAKARDFRVRVVAFQDNLTPDEFEAKAADHMRALYGSHGAAPADKVAPLSDDEMQGIHGIEDDGQDVDDQAVANAQQAAFEAQDARPAERARQGGGQDPGFDPSTIPGVTRGMPGERLQGKPAQGEVVDDGAAGQARAVTPNGELLPPAAPGADDDAEAASAAFDAWQAQQDQR